MKCERCQTGEATTPFTTLKEGERRVLQLCLRCVSTFHWDEEGRLTGTDLANLGFAPQPGWNRVLEDVKKAREEGSVRTKEEALEFAKKHPALRIRPSDIRFKTAYVPGENWVGGDPMNQKVQPGFDEQVAWWKGEMEAGRMVMYGIAIEGRPGMVLVGWTCATLEEAERLANATPWVSTKVLAVLQTAPASVRQDS